MKTAFGLWLVCLLGLYFTPVFAQAESDGWKSVLKESGIELFQRNLRGKDYQQQRGMMVIDGTVAGLVGILEDATQCPKWLYGCRSSKVVKQISTGERVNYTVVDAPFILSDRDMYIRSKAIYDSRAKAVTISLHGLENFDKAQESRVRVKSLSGFWRFQEVNEKQVRVDYQMYNDPQITPVSAVNTTIPKNLFQTFNRLRRLAGSPAFRNMRFDPVKLKSITIR